MYALMYLYVMYYLAKLEQPEKVDYKKFANKNFISKKTIFFSDYFPYSSISFVF